MTDLRDVRTQLKDNKAVSSTVMEQTYFERLQALQSEISAEKIAALAAIDEKYAEKVAGIESELAAILLLTATEYEGKK